MKNTDHVAIVMATALFAAWLLAPTPALGQAPTADQARAANEAALGPALTVYDRQGKVVRTVGDLGAFYAWPAFSPDGKRVAVVKRDESTQKTDVWVFDLPTGASTRITSDPASEGGSPVWSPDGSQIVYASNPGGSGGLYRGLYRKAANGTGSAELLYQHPTNLQVTDWSADGRFLTFTSAASMYVLPLTAAGGAPPAPGDRKATEIVSGQGSRAAWGRFSPDSRFLAYAVSQTGTGEIQLPWEVWVRPFDPSTASGAAPAAGPWQISDQEGGGCTCAWRQDGKEMYYQTPDGGMMAVEIGTAQAFTSGRPRLLFQAPSSINSNPISAATVSRDGQQFVFTETAAFARNARVLMAFDREGKTVGTIGGRGLYDQPVFSPDRTRVAVIQNPDLWVIDVVSGASTLITSSKKGDRREVVRTPVWSPDGRQVAYVAVRGGNEGLYRKASNGDGAEELLYRIPGSLIRLTDWSMDARFLVYDDLQLGGNILWALPLDGDRQPVELVRSQFEVQEPRISPDNRFMAYCSNETGKSEIFVRAFNPTGAVLPAATSGPWQVSNNEGGVGMIVWRQDGTELGYMGADRGVKAVSVRTAPAFEFGKPRTLFTLPDGIRMMGTPGARGNMARDGQRVVFSVPLTIQLKQIAVFDRQGNVLRKVGEPGLYQDGAALSPDGTRVAVQTEDPQTGNRDIWTFDVASGKGTPVTNDTLLDRSPIWSPDGRQVAYVSIREGFRSIYRKAWDGTGNEELLFQYTRGASVTPTDWSADGKFLTFFPGQMSYLILVVPLSGDQQPLERKAIEWLRQEYDVAQGRISPDSRFMAYLSNEVNANTFDVYVRPFDASKPEAGTGDVKPVKVSTAGARGGIFWRQDGKELYYLAPGLGVMAVDVTTAPRFQAGTPRLLFQAPTTATGNTFEWNNVSGDGERFVFAINVPVSALFKSLIPLEPIR